MASHPGDHHKGDGRGRDQNAAPAPELTTNSPPHIPLNEAILPLRSAPGASHSTSTSGFNTPMSNASRSDIDLPSAINGKGLAPLRDRSAERDATNHLRYLTANNTGSSVYSVQAPSRKPPPIPPISTTSTGGSHHTPGDGKSINDEPVLLSANLSTLDLPFSEFSTSYSPMNSYVNSSSMAAHSRDGSHEKPHHESPNTLAVPIAPQYSGEHVQSPLEQGTPSKIISQHTGSTNPFQRDDRQDSTVSNVSQVTASSAGWNPGGDVSLFDASTSRGQRLGSDADEGILHRTWSEQTRWEAEKRNQRALDAQAAAERARIEEAAREAEEEWWNAESPGPVLPPKEFASAQSSTARRALPAVHRVPVPSSQSSLPPSSSQSSQFPKVRSMIDAAIEPEHGQNRSLQPPLSPVRARGGSSSARTGKSETYAIKQIDWTSIREGNARRKSPILVQNLNGPCPLLALVNTLILSTPKNVKTPLLEALSAREQISLGLLLDNVFEELMSERRQTPSGKLPDVEQLYAFLLTLHTGMNVNPRFVQDRGSNQQLLDIPVVEGSRDTLAMFEVTRELELYDSFSVPLLHGWLPPVDHPAHEAVRRSAPSFEEAQNILLREDDLAQKMMSGGLSPEERQLMDDIIMIKDFMQQSATQLTEYGLGSLAKMLLPGEFAILFRNDHFSTLYKHPDSGFLFTLVTDAGYATHEEIVWESLVDVTGEGCELCTGDFKPVSQFMNDAPSPRAANDRRTSHSSPNAGNNTARNRSSIERSSRTPPRTAESHHSAQSPSTEQEDRDFALALQMQMEEDERQQREAERRREDEQSQAFIRAQTNQTTSSLLDVPVALSHRPSEPDPPGARLNRLPPRTGPPAAVADAPRRSPLTHRPADDDGADVPPPTYEQAASGPAYIPPPNHPAHPGTSLAAAQNAASSPNQSAYSQTSAGQGAAGASSSAPGLGGRRPSRPTATQIRHGAQRMLEEIQATSAAQRRRPSVQPGYPGTFANEFPSSQMRRNPNDPNKDCSVM